MTFRAGGEQEIGGSAGGRRATARRSTRVALVTYRQLPTLSADDRLALAPLARRGVEADAVAWDDPCARWAAYDTVVIRSSWDYHLRVDEFRAWLARLDDEGAAVWNPTAVLRWNVDKRYLAELARRGVPVVPTRWVEPGHDASLAALLDETGWDEVVVKPAVSASAHETWRTARARADRDAHRFADQARRRALLVQPLLRCVERDGELSFVFIAGRFSHAVRKRACAGEFRVQEHLGGTAEAAVPSPSLVADAAAALAAAPGPTLYARVDGCAIDGRLVLMELELLEPSLFLSLGPAAADAFAAALAAVAGQGAAT